MSAGLRRLSEQGVRPGDSVVLATGNRVEGWLAYHSLLRAGATNVLLDRRCGLSDLRRAVDLLGSHATVIASVDRRAQLPEGLSGIDILPIECFG